MSLPSLHACHFVYVNVSTHSQVLFKFFIFFLKRASPHDSLPGRGEREKRQDDGEAKTCEVFEDESELLFFT